MELSGNLCGCDAGDGGADPADEGIEGHIPYSDAAMVVCAGAGHAAAGDGVLRKLYAVQRGADAV